MGILSCVILALLVTIAACQTQTSSSVLHPFQSLSPAGAYDDGGFRTPNTSTQGYIFTAGRNMNVTWWTKYTYTNLWLIKGDEFDSPIKIVMQTTQKWHEWVVDDQGDNSKPYHFRGTNPLGTTEEQNDGGFWTGEFWVRPAPTTSTTSVPATSTNSKPKKTSSAVDKANKGSSSSSVGIGAGVGVGVGVTVIAAGVLIFWCLRRRKKRKAEKQWPAPNTRPVERPPYRGAPYTSPSQGGSSTQWSRSAKVSNAPVEMSSANSRSSKQAHPWRPTELAGEGLRSPVEAPADQWDPRELPADDRWKTPGSTGLPGR